MSDSRIIPFERPAQSPIPAVLTISNVHITRCGNRLLKNASLELSGQGVTALIGANGAGKSVLLRMITGLIAPDKGHVSLADSHKNPALVFQKPVLLRRSVRRNLLHALKIAGVARAHRQGRLAELLVLADLTQMSETPARALSGGQQQRLAFARALAQDPKLLLLDEPTASLDPESTAKIETLTRSIADNGVKVVFVTHDRAQAERIADDVAFLADGTVTEHRNASLFFSDPKSIEAQCYLAGKLAP